MRVVNTMLEFSLPNFLGNPDVGMCGFNMGLGMVWIAVFLSKVGEEVDIKLNNVEESSIASCIHVGVIIAGIPSYSILDELGSRCLLLISINVQILAWIIIYFIPEIWAILTARLMMGIFAGCTMISCPEFMTATASSSIRGRIFVLYLILIVVGYLFLTAIGPFISYKNVALTSFILSFTQFVTLLYTPESVYTLLKKNKDEEAEKVLEWLRGQNDVKEEFDRIKQHLGNQMNRDAGFKSILKWPVSRKAFIQAASLYGAQKLNGYQALTAYTAVILPDSWVSHQNFPVIWNSINLIFLMIALFYMDRINHRTLLAISGLGSGIFSFVTAVWYFLHENTNVDTSTTLWVPLVSLSLQTAFYASGLLCVPLLFIGEVLPINIKSKANSLIIIVGSIESLGIVQIFMPIRNSVGTWGNFFLYSLASAISVYVSRIIIETRNQNLERIQEILEEKISEEYMFAQK